jgi:hypothetical protein
MQSIVIRKEFTNVEFMVPSYARRITASNEPLFGDELSANPRLHQKPGEEHDLK